MDEFGLVGSRHHRHIRQAGEIGDVESARVRRAVRADQPGAIEGEADRQVLNRHVMHELVVAALQEGRIDGAERPVAFRRQASGKRHRMLLGNADVEHPLGKDRLHSVQSGPVRHGGGNADDFGVATRFLDQRVGEDTGIGGRVGLGLRLGAGDDIKRRNAMVLVVGRLGRRIALALLGHHVDEHGSVLHVANVLQDRQKMVEIVAVDWSDIIEAELLEQGAARPEVAAIFLRTPGLVVEERGQAARELLGHAPQRAIGAA